MSTPSPPQVDGKFMSAFVRAVKPATASCGHRNQRVLRAYMLPVAMNA